MTKIKNLLSILFSVFLCFSCENLTESDTDAFIGTYSVSTIEEVSVPSSNYYRTYTNTYTLIIEKVSTSKVHAYNYFDTYGEVTGDKVYFESFTSSAGMTTVFGAGTLSGNILTWTAVSTGEWTNNGISYPAKITYTFTGIKQ